MPIVEFVVIGTPMSFRASPNSRAKWCDKIIAAAKEALPNDLVPLASPLQVHINYFFNTTDLDLDNILKPILDALKGIVYVDDRHIVDIFASMRDIAGPFILSDAPPILANQLALTQTKDFIFVSVDLADIGNIP